MMEKEIQTDVAILKGVKEGTKKGDELTSCLLFVSLISSYRTGI
jgi:hypothetical protein